MLYYLFFFLLRPHFSPLNVFRYITVRTALASLTALFLTLVFGPWTIRRLREMQIGQFIRAEGPERHQRGRHRRAGQRRQRAQFGGGVRIDHAAPGVQHGPPGEIGRAHV